MGMRFRKSINLGGGARVNISKSGIGGSIGGKGYRYTKKANGGTRNTVSIPGTGISYVKESGSKSKKKSAEVKAMPQGKVENHIEFAFFWIIYRVMGFITFPLGLLLLLVEPLTGICSIGLSVVFYFGGNHYKKKRKANLLEIERDEKS